MSEFIDLSRPKGLTCEVSMTPVPRYLAEEIRLTLIVDSPTWEKSGNRGWIEVVEAARAFRDRVERALAGEWGRRT